MAFIHSPSYIQLLHAYREPERLNNLAQDLSSYCTQQIAQHKTKKLTDYWTSLDSKKKAIHLPIQPFYELFTMQWKEGSDFLRMHFKKDACIASMDCSVLVMHLVKNRPESLVWAIEEGWGSFLGLLKSRQSEMDWYNVTKAFASIDQSNALDSWLRLWEKRNPSILQHIINPTFEECKKMLVEQNYVFPKQFKILKGNAEFCAFCAMLEAVGSFDTTGNIKNLKYNASLFKTFFEKKLQDTIALPESFALDL